MCGHLKEEMWAPFGTLPLAVFCILVSLNVFSLERGSGSSVWHSGDDGSNVFYFSSNVRHSGGKVLNVYWQ